MPERTCTACRRKAPAEALFRMVAGPGGEVAAELGSRLPGRGTHCCFRAECVRAALKVKNLERALRARVKPPEAAELTGRLRALLRGRVEGLLSAGWRKGGVAAGREAALRAARAAREGRLFLAEDLSEGSRREAAEGGAEPVRLPLAMEEVGRLLGRRPVGVLFVADASLADSLALRASQARSLGAT